MRVRTAGDCASPDVQHAQITAIVPDHQQWIAGREREASNGITLEVDPL
jgi:hypothetical protein